VTLSLAKEAVDIGIVTMSADRMLGFYRDTLSMKYKGEFDMGGGITMHRLVCGKTLFKLVTPAEAPAAKSPANGVDGSTGIRYLTVSVDDLESMTEACILASYKMIVSLAEISPGIRVSMVEDPDGNWIEFLHIA